MYDITRDNYVIWNNNTITPSQLYLKKHLISIPTFNILNSSKFFTKVSICDLKWAIQKHFLLFLKSYSILILSNVLISIHDINMFKVFTILKRVICFYL